MNMSEELRFISPGIKFDPRLADELARDLTTIPAVGGEAGPVAERRSPFRSYSRMLTPEGGILISYRDKDCGLFLTILRVFTWAVATGLGGKLVFSASSLNGIPALLAFAIVSGVSFLIVRQTVEASHSIEIRPDAMIVDGRDVFYAEDIGDNWPELQKQDDDPDRMVIAGTCGTRYIEFMTAHRLDESDRTPEVLAADLQAAMEQLWGRREVTFPAAS